MKFIKKLFTETEITWKLLLVYSVVTGVTVGLLNCIPFLENTSFVAPAVTLEYWFVAALFIIANCKSGKEAMLKTFLFFLISQPLIYLVEVPFKAAGWGLFGYYKYWAVITVLTIPGAWIAYQVKRDNLLSAVILSVATGFLLAMGIKITMSLFTAFPYGLVSALFCLVFSVVLILAILEKKKTKITAFICTAVFAAVILFAVTTTAASKTAGIMLDAEHQWEIISTDTTAEITGSYLNISSKESGTFRVTVRDENGETQTYEVTFESESITIGETD